MTMVQCGHAFQGVDAEVDGRYGRAGYGDGSVCREGLYLVVGVYHLNPKRFVFRGGQRDHKFRWRVGIECDARLAAVESHVFCI